jgi:hypothetical protein
MLDRPIALYAKQDFVFRNTTYNFVDGKKITPRGEWAAPTLR